MLFINLPYFPLLFRTTQPVIRSLFPDTSGLRLARDFDKCPSPFSPHVSRRRALLRGSFRTPPLSERFIYDNFTGEPYRIVPDAAPLRTTEIRSRSFAYRFSAGRLTITPRNCLELQVSPSPPAATVSRRLISLLRPPLSPLQIVPFPS